MAPILILLCSVIHQLRNLLFLYYWYAMHCKALYYIINNMTKCPVTIHCGWTHIDKRVIGNLICLRTLNFFLFFTSQQDWNNKSSIWCWVVMVWKTHAYYNQTGTKRTIDCTIYHIQSPIYAYTDFVTFFPGISMENIVE